MVIDPNGVADLFSTLPDDCGNEVALSPGISTVSTVSTDCDSLLTGVRTGAWLDAQTFPPLDYAIPGLIPEGTTILIGPPKVGKSYLLGGLLLATAAGGYALGAIPVGPARPVLYLALEDGDRRMQKRCRELLGDGQPIPPLFHYLTKVPPRSVIPTIEAFLQRYPDTALVVLDTLGKVMPEARPGESAYQRDYRVMGALKAVSDAYPGLSLVVVHHDRKAVSEDFVDAVSGTNGLAGAADTIMVLVRKRQSSDGLLKVTGRDVPEAEYALTVAAGQWSLDGRDLVDAAETAQHREQSDGLGDRSVQIVATVNRHPAGIGPTKLAALLGMEPNNAGEYLRRLAAAGRIGKAGRGMYCPVHKSVETVETVESAGQGIDNFPHTHGSVDTGTPAVAGHGKHECRRCRRGDGWKTWPHVDLCGGCAARHPGDAA